MLCQAASVKPDSATPWTVAHQAPLSMGFSRQEYGVGCHFLLQGIFPTQGLNSGLLHCRQIQDIEGFGEYPVSEGIISLQNDRSSSYKKYVEIQNVLVKALNTIRDQFARSNFGKVYNELDADQQEIVRKAIPNRISESEPKDVSKK